MSVLLDYNIIFHTYKESERERLKTTSGNFSKKNNPQSFDNSEQLGIKILHSA